MPALKVSDKAAAPLCEKQGPSADAITRLLSMAAHPAIAGTAPKIVEIDLDRAHSQILPGFKHLLDYPRATIRPVPGAKPGHVLYVAKIWHRPGVPVVVNGVWVTKNSDNAAEVFWWAQRTVEEFRDVEAFGSTGRLGASHRRWAPRW